MLKSDFSQQVGKSEHFREEEEAHLEGPYLPFYMSEIGAVREQRLSEIFHLSLNILEHCARQYYFMAREGHAH